MTIEDKANELVQALNIDTLPLVTHLDDEANLQRAFGGSVSDQLILLTKSNISQEKFDKIKKVFKEAASFNK
jgi:hypothetical protein